MRQRLPWLIGAGVLVLAVIVTLVMFLVVLPSGASSAENAALDRIRGSANTNTARVLVTRKWGDGRLVLAAYSQGEERRNALGFAIEQARGWRLAAYTEETVTTKDVAVASLVVASSEGGDGQPAWSVAAGELSDSRIERVEIRWASGQTSTGKRENDAYLVVQEGTTVALEARYLGKDGTEIARVPV